MCSCCVYSSSRPLPKIFRLRVSILSQFFAPIQRLKPMINIGNNSLKMLLISSITLSLIVNKRVYLWPFEKVGLSQTTQSGYIILSGFFTYDSRNLPEWACFLRMPLKAKR